VLINHLQREQHILLF